MILVVSCSASYGKGSTTSCQQGEFHPLLVDRLGQLRLGARRVGLPLIFGQLEPSRRNNSGTDPRDGGSRFR